MIRKVALDTWLAAPTGLPSSLLLCFLPVLSLVDYRSAPGSVRNQTMIAAGSGMVVMFRRLAKSDHDLYKDLLVEALNRYGFLLYLISNKWDPLRRASYSFQDEAYGMV